MKNIRFLTFVLTIATLLLSACGAAATPAAPAPITTGGSSKVNAMPVAFVGVVDSIAGDQWVISGTKVTVDKSIVRDGPFSVGDRIKVEGFVNPDGSLTVSRVETPAPQDAATQPSSVEDNSNDAIGNANTNDANVNDDNSSAVNSNDASANVNDDNSNSVNSNDASTNVNDDHGGNVNASNDNSSTANSNDDKGGSGGSNSNDDKGGSGGGGNSNDDNGNGG